MASDLSAAADAIEQAFRTGWDGQTPVAYPGVDFDPPAGPWARFEILWGDGFELTIGESGAKNEIAGVVHVSIFDRQDKGRGVIDGHADAARDLLSRTEISGVRFGVASGPTPPTAPRDGWQQAVVKAAFTLEETI